MVIETKKGAEIRMTYDQLTEAVNACERHMAEAKELHNSATTLEDKRLGAAMYDAFHSLYMILQEKLSQEKRDPPPNNKWRYYLD